MICISAQLFRQAVTAFENPHSESREHHISNPENPDELLAKSWLTSLAGDTGSVCRIEHDPPDYVLNGEIAVEVTRLTDGDETSLHSLGAVVEDVLKSLEPPGHGRSLAVLCVYPQSPRNLPLPKVLAKEIRDALTPYTKWGLVPGMLEYLSRAGLEDLPMPGGLSLRLVNCLPPTEAPRFAFFGWYDWDEHVRRGILKGFEDAVRKKSEAVRNRVHHRGTWWLVFVDRVFNVGGWAFVGTDDGKRNLRDLKPLTHELARTEGTCWPWSRNVVLAPQDPDNGYVLWVGRHHLPRAGPPGGAHGAMARDGGGVVRHGGACRGRRLRGRLREPDGDRVARTRCDGEGLEHLMFRGIRRLMERRSARRDEVGALEERLVALRREVGAREERLVALRREAGGLEKRLVALRHEVGAFERRRAWLHLEVGMFEEAGALEERLVALRREVSAFEEAGGLEKRLVALRREVSALEECRAALRREVGAFKEVNSLEKRCAKLRNEVRELEGRRAALCREVGALFEKGLNKHLDDQDRRRGGR